MKFTGQFRDRDNNLIQVDILNGDQTKVVEIGGNNSGVLFSGDPVIIEQGNDDMFSHVIKTSCEINLLINEYLPELYSNNARSTKVTVRKNGIVVFAGFAEPLTYEQPYIGRLQEFTINALCGLSTLQNYNFKNATAKNFDTIQKGAGVSTFKEIINDALGGILNVDANSDVRSHVYYDGSKGITDSRLSNVFDDLSVSDMCFSGKEFDDIMNTEETLETVLKYLNLHIVQYGLDYYIFDWDSIKKKNTSWVDIMTGEALTTSPETITLTSAMHSSDDTSITVGECFNQVQLNVKIDNVDEIITSPLDTDSLTSLYSNKQKYMTEIISEGEGKTAFGAFKAMITGGTTTYEDAKKIDWYARVLDNKNWKLYIDPANGTTIDSLYQYDTINGRRVYKNMQDVFKRMRYSTLYPCIIEMGSVSKNVGKQDDNDPVSQVGTSNYLFIPINGNENDSNPSPSDNVLQSRSGIIEYVGSSAGISLSPSDTGTTNYIVFEGKMMLQPIQKETAYYSVLRNKYTSNPNSEEYFHVTVPSDNNGDGRYYTRKWYNQTYPTDIPTEGQYLVGEHSLQPWTEDKANHLYQYNYTRMVGLSAADATDKFKKLPILECELIIGNKRLVETDMDMYGNSTFRWVTIGEEPTVFGEKVKTFTLGVNPKLQDWIIGTEFDMQNTLNVEDGVDAKGTAIPIKYNDKLSGAIIFRILGPVNLVWNDIVRRHPSFWRHTKYTENDRVILSHLENIIIRDFTCKIYSNNGGLSTLEDKDLIYVSAETDDYVESKDDLEFNIYTQLTSEESFDLGVKQSTSMNAVSNNFDDVPLRSIYNKNTALSSKPEEQYVAQAYNILKDPAITMQCTLHTDRANISPWNIYHSNPLNRDMAVISMSMNLKNNDTTLKMRQLWSE